MQQSGIFVSTAGLVAGLALYGVQAALAAAILLPRDTAQSGDYTVVQQETKFDREEITIKVGESVTFVNGDPYVHNIYSLTKGHEFDVGAQEPGHADTIRFTTQGKLKVRCAIHPKLKMTIIITP